MSNKILSHNEIQFKIRRIAYQIFETFSEEDRIVVAGIEGGGSSFAKRISDILEEITEAEIIRCEIKMNKEDPISSPISTDVPEAVYRDRCVVVVDVVLNSGTSLMYGVAHFLKTPLKKLKTAVLVNRNHKRYPVKADYKGISLSTSLNEHVRVRFRKNNDAVFLED